MLQRKDAAKGVSFLGHPASRVHLSAHNSAQIHNFASGFLKLGVITHHATKKIKGISVKRQ